MKFLFVAPRFHTNQVNWVNSLIENQHEVIFHSQIVGATENYSTINPSVFYPCKLSIYLNKIIGNGGINNPRGFPNPTTYWREIKLLKPDVIIVRDIARWFSFMAAVFARVLGVKVLIYSQTDLHKHYSVPRKIITKIILYVFKAKWITPVLGNVSDFPSYPKGLYFVPFSVDINQKEMSQSIEGFKLLSIGKFEDRKNHLMLLKVIKLLIDDGFNLQLKLVGEVSKDVHKKNLLICKNFIEENSLTDFVSIIINVPHIKIMKLYRESDLFILPATEEPASISILESVGQGIPAICSDTNGTQCYLTQNNFGITFKNNDSNHLFQQIKYLLDIEKLQYFHNNINRKVETVLSKSVFYNCLISLLDND